MFVCVCVCSLIYVACQANVPYCHSSVARLVLLYISTLCHEQHDFRKEVTELCVFFSTNLNLFIIVLCGFVYLCNLWGCVCVGFVLYGCVRLM